MEVVREHAYSRAQNVGLQALSNVDLLAIVLSRTERDLAENESEATKLLTRYPGARLADLGLLDLEDAAGLESFEATRVLASMELGRRIAGSGKQAVQEVNNDQDAYRLFRYLEKESREHFCVASLNSKNGVIAVKTIHIGTLNMSIVGPREVFREAVRSNAASIILAHNHPSGDPTPSPEDIEITRKLIEVGATLDIRVHDHVIIGDGRFTSLYQERLL
ncbi:MAG: DNA repair protein RadC [Armatimonadetes bacterium]|nr:DNA repair protein RadC [Armatimonadota bacterium]